MTDTLDFTPSNEIEKALIAAQKGDIDIDNFMQQLLGAQLFFPIEDKHQIGGLQDTNKAKFLSLEDEDNQSILIAFSAPERGQTFLKDFPAYQGGLLVDIPWLIEKLGVGFGVSLNPGLPVGFDLEANMLEMIAAQIQGEKA